MYRLRSAALFPTPVEANRARVKSYLIMETKPLPPKPGLKADSFLGRHGHDLLHAFKFPGKCNGSRIRSFQHTHPDALGTTC